MNLFADKWPSAFDNNPFGLDGFRSSSLGGFRWGSNVFGDRSDNDDFHSKMRIRNAPSLAERGFYDDFDSVFHDLRSPSGRHFDFRADDSFSQRSSSSSTPKGKEYIIPIKVETSSSKPERNGSLFYTNKVGDEVHSRLNGYTGSQSSSPPSGCGSGTRGRVIHIPIVRETKSHTSPREKSRSPPKFTPLIPTTEENRSQRRSGDRKDDDVICLDSDAFFTQSRNTPRRYRPNKYDSDIEIVDVEEKEEESSSSRSLRRNPIRHDADVSPSRNFTSRDEEICSASRSSSYDVRPNDVRHEEEEAEREKSEGQSKKSCAHPGVTNVTPPPSYPIYDHLRPR
eukprot:GHVL01024023.1.p1 GENE.GHVL01024023.1~~GHVL01024023.1.p1  ORF type:complete len:340 (+),score=36.38 GHVL01024023.1:245-1264(+)